MDFFYPIFVLVIAFRYRVLVSGDSVMLFLMLVLS